MADSLQENVRYFLDTSGYRGTFMKLAVDYPTLSKPAQHLLLIADGLITPNKEEITRLKGFVAALEKLQEKGEVPSLLVSDYKKIILPSLHEAAESEKGKLPQAIEQFVQEHYPTIFAHRAYSYNSQTRMGLNKLIEFLDDIATEESYSLRYNGGKLEAADFQVDEQKLEYKMQNKAYHTFLQNMPYIMHSYVEELEAQNMPKQIRNMNAAIETWNNEVANALAHTTQQQKARA